MFSIVAKAQQSIGERQGLNHFVSHYLKKKKKKALKDEETPKMTLETQCISGIPDLVRIVECLGEMYSKVNL